VEPFKFVRQNSPPLRGGLNKSALAWRTVIGDGPEVLLQRGIGIAVYSTTPMKLFEVTVTVAIVLMAYGLLDGFISLELGIYLAAVIFAAVMAWIYVRRKPPAAR
jgi:hypothetical protein